MTEDGAASERRQRTAEAMRGSQLEQWLDLDMRRRNLYLFSHECIDLLQEMFYHDNS
jgi:hypothetical protein